MGNENVAESRKESGCGKKVRSWERERKRNRNIDRFMMKGSFRVRSSNPTKVVRKGRGLPAT
jgi:hypothetical protein